MQLLQQDLCHCSLPPAAMEAKISEALEAERVSVSDVYGDGRHVNIDVVSEAFEGKNSVQRQRMVYKVSSKDQQKSTLPSPCQLSNSPGMISRTHDLAAMQGLIAYSWLLWPLMLVIVASLT